MTDQPPNPVEIAGAMLRKKADQMAVQQIYDAHKQLCEKLSTGPFTTQDEEGQKRLLELHRDRYRAKIEEDMAKVLVELCMKGIAKKDVI